MSFFIHTLEALIPPRDRRRRTTGVREQESTSIQSQAAPVIPFLSTQPLTPHSSANANERADLSQPHSQLESNNVLITGGELSEIHGHQANVVIHINHSTSAGSPSGPPSGFLPSNDTDHNPTPSSGQSTQHNYERVSSQAQEIPLQRSNDIYERHLTPKGRGFPLWIPGPNQVLHIDYRRTGIRIGDVGIITHSGGFSFLFNICLPHNDPVNPRVLPEHFAPISPPIEATDVDEFMAFGNGSHLASASINRLQTDIDISFESSASEGAILTMPRGARSEDLGNFARFREYAAANVADWYKFVNGPRGREAKNGDVRLVVGFDKTTSWGMATFANQTRQNNCRLTFRPLEGAGLTTSPGTYAWEYSGVAEVRAGPDSNQNDRLRMDNDPLDVQFENQCLFMRTLNITLADNVWADIHSSLGSVHVGSQNNQTYPPVKHYSSNHPHSNDLGTSSPSFVSSQGVQSGTQRTASPLHGADAKLDDNPTMLISGPLDRIMVHPSKVLNEILLAAIPTAKMVITHDNDWSSFITQYDTFPDLREVAMNILSSQNICEENGVIFLQPEVLAGSASLKPVEAVGDSNSPQDTSNLKPTISRKPTTALRNATPFNPNSQRSSSKPPNRDPSPAVVVQEDNPTWNSNFWVTLVDPKTQTSFFACPATGEVSWDPPVGKFFNQIQSFNRTHISSLKMYGLPPGARGEWWEITDKSQGLPYYYQTTTGETVWERPDGFVIPLGIIQNTVLGRSRLSRTTFDHFSKMLPTATTNQESIEENPIPSTLQPNESSINVARSSSTGRSISSSDTPNNSNNPPLKRHNIISVQISPIPGSPYVFDNSTSYSLSSKHSFASIRNEADGNLSANKGHNSSTMEQALDTHSHSPQSKSSSYTSIHSQPPQSHDAALEILTPQSDNGNGEKSITEDWAIGSTNHGYSSLDEISVTPSKSRSHRGIQPSSSRYTPIHPTVGGKGISGPIFNHAATQMSPVRNHATGRLLVEPQTRATLPNASIATLGSGTYPILSHALTTDIQHFSESEYAKKYFSTHRTGFIFRRRVPVEQLMTWQKTPLTSPLLVLNRGLQKNAVKVFRVIQHITGDREPDHAILEEERWLLNEGLTHGELRDEIYCQLMKQLSGNPSRESIFKGWQLLCVLLITFPPSKNFEAYLQAFIQKHTTQQEGRVEVMAKYCLRRLVTISKKGPRGKPPMIAEIETASDAAFNPSTFGESLDGIIRLQERNYPHEKIPIILPFLADGILALGGTKAEGIFRVPGDNDSVASLKLRIDRGFYTLDGVDDPHVLASLMKLWLRELCDPLVPEEFYSECIQSYKDAEVCIQIVKRLPTINRRVVLFVISFLQIFLEERTQSVTKMTPANLALVMAPNLLRCNSESMSVVFTNAQYEQIFVYNLLLHLRCEEVDSHYKPTHGLGVVSSTTVPKVLRNRPRRSNQ